MTIPARTLIAAGAILSATCVFAEPLTLSVAKAEVSLDRLTADLVLTLNLSADSTKAFADFTTANVGRNVELRIDGDVLMTAHLREPIVGGTVQVNGFSGPELKAVADRISKGAVKVEVEAAAK